MEQELTEYQQDLILNEYALELECADQPRKFMKWAERYALAVFERDKAKQNLKVTIAETNLSIRNREPEDYGLSKWTENAVQSVLDKHPDVLEAENQYLEAIKNLELLRAAKDAFQDRKFQLINLVSLRNAQYYSDPLREQEAREAAARVAQEKALEADM
jgi:hypothetical protein